MRRLLLRQQHTLLFLMGGGQERRKSWQVAAGGLAAALCVVLLFLTGLVPFSTFVLPGLAGLALLPVAVELGSSTGWVVYAAAGLLSLLVAPDREAALLFLFFLGYYPMARMRLPRGRGTVLLKAVWFNAAVLGCYGLLLWLFGAAFLWGGDAPAARWFWLALLAAANGVFWLYDRAVENLTLLYFLRWRPKLMRRR